MADIAYRDDLTYRNDSMVYGGPGRVSWGAIWAGVFTFCAIWIVFETLAFALFAGRAANPNAVTPVTGPSIGIAIWSIILTIIAMYVAGRETGHLAAVTNRHDGLIHGMIMFGLSLVAVLILSSLAGAVLSGGSGILGTGARGGSALGIFPGLGWAGFLALLLGWLAAMAGGSQGVAKRNEPPTHTARDVRDIRPAA